jgi:hypothetical protein
MYPENNLRVPNRLAMCGTPVDLRRVDQPAYVLATVEDHIVPWRSAYPDLQGVLTAHHFISSSSFRASPNSARICLRSAIASLVNSPCLRAFWFAVGAPDPCAPPCMRQRFLPHTAGERQASPERVLAPHRGLASIGPVFLT